MASFAVDGLLRAWANEPAFAHLRQTTSLVIVPFVDMDGVEQGDQGKLRAPYDHNRSYQSQRYPETVAVRNLVDGEARRNLPTYSLDLHCPYVRGAETNEHVYIVGSGIPERAAEQYRFAAVLAQGEGERFGFLGDDLLPHGTSWNTLSTDPAHSCATWFAARPSCRLSATFEIPYGRARGHLVTDVTARAFGASLAQALRRYAEGHGLGMIKNLAQQ